MIVGTPGFKPWTRFEDFTLSSYNGVLLLQVKIDQGKSKTHGEIEIIDEDSLREDAFALAYEIFKITHP